MRAWLIVLAACESTAEVTIDAAPVSKCPPIGTTPQFRAVVHRAVDARCEGYTSGSGIALAFCEKLGNVSGPDDGSPLHPATGLVLMQPRLFAEGDRAIGKQYREIERHIHETTVHVYKRVGDSWQPHDTLPIRRIGGAGSSYDVQLSNVTWAGRVFVESRVKPDDFSSHVRVWQEWTNGGGAWAPINGSYMIGDLGLPDTPFSAALYMTSDGLRLFIGHYYTDHPDLASRFRPVVAFDHATGFMTEDCGRMYVSGLDGIFYMEAR